MSNVNINSVIDSLRQELALKIDELVNEIEDIFQEKVKEALETVQDEIDNGDHEDIGVRREPTQAEILLAEQRKIERELGL